MCSWSSSSEHLHLVGVFTSAKNSGNVHQIPLSRYFREELKPRI